MAPTIADAAIALRYLLMMFFGPPACGKGWQIRSLIAHLELFGIRPAVIVMGDLVRANKELLRQSASGALADDEAIIELLRHELTKIPPGTPIFFDGFPRTDTQVRALIELLRQIDCAASQTVLINLLTNDQACFDRMRARRRSTERETGQSRPDDNDDVLPTRLLNFHSNYSQVVRGTRETGIKILDINNNHAPEEVFRQIISKVVE